MFINHSKILVLTILRILIALEYLPIIISAGNELFWNISWTWALAHVVLRNYAQGFTFFPQVAKLGEIPTLNNGGKIYSDFKRKTIHIEYVVKVIQGALVLSLHSFVPREKLIYQMVCSFITKVEENEVSTALLSGLCLKQYSTSTFDTNHCELEEKSACKKLVSISHSLGITKAMIFCSKKYS